MHGLLAQAHNVVLQLKKKYKDTLAVEKGHSDSLRP